MKSYFAGFFRVRATGLIWLAATALSSGCAATLSSGRAATTTPVAPTLAASAESALVAVATLVATPTQSLTSLNLTPTAASVFAAAATETAVLATETAAAGNTPAAATPDALRPPAPLTLDDVAAEWTRHDFAEWGLSLSMPADWEPRRMEGGVFFAPPSGGNAQLTVGLQGNAPAELAAMTAMLTEDWTYRTPLDFYTTPITISDVEGLAVWNTSPYICADVYLPAHGVVRHISFGAVFCNDARDQFNEVGQKILDSIAIDAPG